jgi:uncharacterized protein YjbI with pentapeptide repeats
MADQEKFDLGRANLRQHADLVGADLRGTVLPADLTDADLRSVELPVDLGGADLRGTVLEGAILPGSDQGTSIDEQSAAAIKLAYQVTRD